MSAATTTAPRRPEALAGTMEPLARHSYLNKLDGGLTLDDGLKLALFASSAETCRREQSSSNMSH
jgi:hypothetical protein